MKAVIIMRGLPGSGKSTVANKLAAEVPESVIVSADKFFNGGAIDVRALGYAHTWCQQQYEDALKEGYSLIIVDNTNTTKGEIQTYYQKALDYGYEATIMEVVCDIQTSVARNIHSVPRDTIEAMANKMATSPLDPSWQIVRYG